MCYISGGIRSAAIIAYLYYRPPELILLTFANQAHPNLLLSYRVFCLLLLRNPNHSTLLPPISDMLAYSSSIFLDLSNDETLPLTPVDNQPFSFCIPEANNLNPFHQSSFRIRAFSPISVSTPRKSPHSVSMPSRPHRVLIPGCPSALSMPALLPPPKPTRLFSIKVQSATSPLDSTTLVRPARGRRTLERATRRATSAAQAKRTKAGRVRKSSVFWLQTCGLRLRRQLCCSTQTLDETFPCGRGYYFL